MAGVKLQLNVLLSASAIAYHGTLQHAPVCLVGSVPSSGGHFWGRSYYL